MIDAGSSIITALFVVAIIIVAIIVSVAVTLYVCGYKLKRVTGSGNASDTRRKQL
ncbi:MAG: hypothetical protein IID58_03905 [Proteobacteria bacterium]|nr:hypothetical protein [Pseudomonadota bacterium]